MGRFLEQWIPYAAATACVAAWYWFDLPFPKDVKEFLAAALSYGAILTGFLATAKAILMALPSDSVMGQIRTSGYIDDLVSYIAQAFFGSIIFCTINLVGFFLDLSKLAREFQLVWIFFAVMSSLAFVRVGRILLRILRLSPSAIR
jgi:hypothetical protein